MFLQLFSAIKVNHVTKITQSAYLCVIKSRGRGSHPPLPLVPRWEYEFACTSSWADWTRHRMPLLQMQSLADHSTHLKATCNFPTHGLKKKKRLRARQAKKSRLFRYIFVSVSSLWVHKHQVRGISCENCTAATKQGNFSSWTSNSYKSKTEFGCDLDGSPGVNGSENNFGQYRLNTANSAYRCSSSSASTTQHWLGSVYSL